MQRFLTLYLLVTGIGGLIVLAAPWLVIMGMFALVLPGIIMSFLPTAFLYGLVFTGGWLAARGLVGEGWLAIGAGLAAAAAFGVLVPLATRLRDLNVYRATILPDVTPPAPLALRGHVRFDLAHPRTRKIAKAGWQIEPGEAGFKCDSLCLAALFTPGVTAVTLNRSNPDDALVPDARTYRLVPRADCRNEELVDWPSITAPLRNDEKGGTGALADGKVLVAQWAMKLATEVCLVMGPSRAGAPDSRLVERTGGSGSTRGRWAFGPGRITTATTEFFANGTLVHRKHVSTLSTLAMPFAILPDGPTESFRFGLARDQFNSRGRYASISFTRSLAEFTDLAGKPAPGVAQDRSALLPPLRARIAEALADPAQRASSPGFQVMETYLDAIGSPAAPEDLDLLARLVSDVRLTEFRGIWSMKLPLGQTRAVYDAYTARLLATGAPMAMAKSGVGALLKPLGAEALRLIGPEQRRLLDDPVKRLAVPELVRALGHGAPEDGWLLLGMLRQHAGVVAEIQRQRQSGEIGGYDRQEERDAHMAALGAVETAFCLLAPQTPTLVAELDGFLHSGAMPPNRVAGNAMTDWNVILARMGKPIESIAKPERLSGTDTAYRDLLRMKVERWRLDRC